MGHLHFSDQTGFASVAGSPTPKDFDDMTDSGPFMKHVIALTCLLLTAATAFAEDAKPTNDQKPASAATLTDVTPSETLLKSMGLRYFKEFSLHAEPGYVLNLEVRYYDEDGRIDFKRSDGVWKLNSEGFADERIGFACLDTADLSFGDDAESRIKFVSSLDASFWLDEGRKIKGFGYYQPPSIAPNEDVKILFVNFEERRHLGRDEAGNLIPQREEGWEPRTSKAEFIVRLEPVDDELRKQFPLLDWPRSSTAYPYRVGSEDRFYPWRSLPTQ